MICTVNVVLMTCDRIRVRFRADRRNHMNFMKLRVWVKVFQGYSWAYIPITNKPYGTAQKAALTQKIITNISIHVF